MLIKEPFVLEKRREAWMNSLEKQIVVEPDLGSRSGPHLQ